MEEEIGSMVSNGETLAIEDLSDSSSRTRPFPARKRAKLGHNICNSKFKGVVPQPNGNWGCQIYANHQRIWLGTFRSEKEAAMAYDSAAIKLRSVDSRRNFPTTDITVEEPKFQNYYSAEAILNMIKDGTYQSKFADFVRTYSNSVEAKLSLNDIKAESNRGLASKQLFRKELTPSDVGKLNRLVIPKKYALKFFPPISENDEENVAAGKADAQLIFYDKSMKLWKFRYCYWKSSQSYVFTRGWNRFIKEKQLKANDTIVFFSCEFGENAESAQTFHMIDVCKENSSSLSNQTILAEVDLQLQLGQGIASDSIKNNFKEERRMGAKPTQQEEKKGLKLFGIQII